MTDQKPDETLVDQLAAAVAERLQPQPEPNPDDVLRRAAAKSAAQRGQELLGRVMTNGTPRRQPPTTADGQVIPDARQGVRGIERPALDFGRVADEFVRGNRRGGAGLSWEDAEYAVRHSHN